ncbi:Uu.00g142710.m01.CDS01 [Anthostomella pinea]|uniref:Uu.00g142710.m01.CDS01 n=1 Tax=Anthostomella pinea TaxID=933095 RepID=A0AAI8YLQ8_9PEZI|nr:Uu.00g142710.m01.CDS01 [Anthostomella pinea]
MANPHPIQYPPKENHFHQKDAVKAGIQGAMIGGGAGLIASSVQNSLAKANVGAMGIFTRSGSTIASFTSVATVYLFTKDASANLREKDDTLNVTVASFLAGSTLGLRTARMPRILGFGAVFSVVMTAFDYTGGSLRGKRTEVPGMDEYERKEFMRKNRRRPITETIADIGEGRDIKPPGYEERRRERLREKYGVEISPVSANVE